jgi:hypothetical protein
VNGSIRQTHRLGQSGSVHVLAAVELMVAPLIKHVHSDAMRTELAGSDLHIPIAFTHPHHRRLSGGVGSRRV